MPRPKPPFGVKRHNRPIADVPITGGINVGITYNLSFALWESAIAAGATLHDLWRMEQGLYPREFMAKVVAWHKGHVAVENHTEVAKVQAANKKKR